MYHLGMHLINEMRDQGLYDVCDLSVMNVYPSFGCTFSRVQVILCLDSSLTAD